MPQVKYWIQQWQPLALTHILNSIYMLGSGPGRRYYDCSLTLLCPSSPIPHTHTPSLALACIACSTHTEFCRFQLNICLGAILDFGRGETDKAKKRWKGGEWEEILQRKDHLQGNYGLYEDSTKTANYAGYTCSQRVYRFTSIMLSNFKGHHLHIP